jgi:hypothetical protein
MMGLLGIITLYTRSLALNRDVVNRTIAAGLAAEGIEVVKNIIDMKVAAGESWGDIQADVPSGTYPVLWNSAALDLQPKLADTSLCFKDDVYAYDCAVPAVATPFKRGIAIGSDTPNKIIVNSVVTWTDQGGAKSLNVEDHFFNWRP